MTRALLVLALLVPHLARAQSTVDVTLSADGKAAAAALGYSESDFATQIKNRVDDAYQTNNVKGFLRSFTDATGFSQRGLGVDYVSAPGSFIVGIAANAAVASDTLLTSSERPTSGGAAVNFGAMVGANLGELADLPRWTIYGNGFYQTASTDRLSGGLLSVGAHAQLKLIEPEEGSGTATLVRWIGLDVTSGLEYTHWSLGAKDSGIKNNFDVGAGAGGSGSETLTLLSKGTFDLTTNTVTLPVEVTTGLRIALVASVFIGAGVDFTVGKSSVNGNLTGDMTDGNGKDIGTVKITASGDNSASPASARVLAGVQLNIWKLKIFVQGNVSQAPAASLAAGIRLVI